jgi:hypothetical protein
METEGALRNGHSYYLIHVDEFLDDLRLAIGKALEE